jgi:hypothetical protein
MAGFRNFHDAILIGTLALLLTTLYTFLPVICLYPRVSLLSDGRNTIGV